MRIAQVYKNGRIRSKVKVSSNFATASVGSDTSNTAYWFSQTEQVIGKDISYVSSTVNGDQFIINTPGFYSFYGSIGATTVGIIGVSVDGTASRTITQQSISNVLVFNILGTANEARSVAGVVYLNQGQIVRAHSAASNVGTNNFINFCIERVG